MLDRVAASSAALPPGPLRRASRMAEVDDWVRGLAGRAVDAGCCVVAVGGYGRGELTAGSDLDVLLLVPDGLDDVAAVADSLWYPMWDAGVRLDHSVRTVREALTVAGDDVRAALGLLDARTVCGDNALRAHLVEALLQGWRKDARARLAELRAMTDLRHERFGVLAHRLEPDLKESVGGLRDVSIVRAVAATNVTDFEHPGLDLAAATLLDVRDELQALTGRASDLLAQQEQDGVAARLGYADRDDLLRAVYRAGRTIAYSAEQTWRRVDASASQSVRRRVPGVRRAADRVPLADGVVVDTGEVVLARDAHPDRDSALLLRSAAAAAQAGLTLTPHSAARLAAECPVLAEPWPAAARDDLVSLLGSGAGLLPVWEALDQHDVWSRLVPEWSVVRSAPQRNPVHIYPVDRHLLQTAIEASALVRTVDRPDLLLVAAWLHDIGKARPGDHSEVGADLVAAIAPRLGFDASDSATLALLVRHHLLLAETATRRDPDDPATIAAVVEVVGDAPTLDLLHALTIADARATGPVAGSEWRLALIDSLVSRVGASVATGSAEPEPDLAAFVTDGPDLTVTLDDSCAPALVTVCAGDFRGLLAATAGVLALHRLEVRTARSQSVGDRAVSQWGVTPMYGEMPDIAIVAQDLRRAVEGSLDVAASLARRAPIGQPAAAPPRVSLAASASARSTVLEVRAHDAPGLLCAIATAITAAGADIVGARVATIGSEALDVFYVADPASGGALGVNAAEDVRAVVAAALAANFVSET